MTEDQADLLLTARDSLAAAKLLQSQGYYGFAASRAYYPLTSAGATSTGPHCDNSGAHHAPSTGKGPLPRMPRACRPARTLWITPA